jgi:hypothetical protein
VRQLLNHLIEGNCPAVNCYMILLVISWLIRYGDDSLEFVWYIVVTVHLVSFLFCLGPSTDNGAKKKNNSFFILQSFSTMQVCHPPSTVGNQVPLLHTACDIDRDIRNRNMDQ